MSFKDPSQPSDGQGRYANRNHGKDPKEEPLPRVIYGLAWYVGNAMFESPKPTCGAFLVLRRRLQTEAVLIHLLLFL